MKNNLNPESNNNNNNIDDEEEKKQSSSPDSHDPHSVTPPTSPHVT